MKKPHSQPMPRVPSSRKDGRFEKGHPLPEKRGGVGVVTSLQTDTVTVLIAGEEVTGVIPLGGMPVVGSVVEVEARGDLLVIPPWADLDALVPIPNVVTDVTPQTTDREINIGGVDDAAWYFIPEQSPGWVDVDAPPEIGTGLRVFQVSVGHSGTLWNRNDFDVSPGDELTFKTVQSKILPSGTATIQLVLLWDAEDTDPQPGTGQTLAYGASVPVTGDAITLDTTVTVPTTFTSAAAGSRVLAPGRARIGLLYVPAPVVAPRIAAPAAVVGADDWADAPTLPYGYRSAPTPSAGLTADAEETAWGAAKTAWWKVTVPADHDPDVTVRVTCLRTYLDVPGDPDVNDNDGETEMRLFTGDSRDSLEQVDRGTDLWNTFAPGTELYIEAHVWDNSEDLARNYVVEVADQTSAYTDWVQGPDVPTGWKQTVPGRSDYRATSVGYGGAAAPGNVPDSPVGTPDDVIDGLKSDTSFNSTTYLTPGTGGGPSIGSGAFGTYLGTHALGHLGAGDWTGNGQREDQGGLFSVYLEDLRFNYRFLIATPPGAQVEIEGGIFSSAWQVQSADLRVPITYYEQSFFPGSETGNTLAVEYWMRPANAYNDAAETPELVTSQTFVGRGTWWLELSLDADQMKNGTVALFPVIDYALTGAWTGFAPQPENGGFYETSAAFTAAIYPPGAPHASWPDGVAPYAQIQGVVTPPRHRFKTYEYTTIDAGGGDPVDVLMSAAHLSGTVADWPVGTLQLNPDAPQGAVPSTDTTSWEDYPTFIELPVYVHFGEGPAPNLPRADIVAPPAIGGISVIIASGNVTVHDDAAPVELRLSPPAVGSMARITSSGPFVLVGTVSLLANERATVTVEHQYVGTAAPTTPAQVSDASVQVTFMPGAVSGGSTSQPLLRYWDGSAWQPPELTGAGVDLSHASTDPPPDPAAVTTTSLLVLPDDAASVGSTITLVADIAPAPTGTVMFARSAAADGPWTNLGTMPVAGDGEAVRTWSAITGTWYFRASYSGSVAYAPSSAVSGPLSVAGAVEERLLVVPGTWVARYAEDGTAMADGGVSQGVLDLDADGNPSSTGRGNQRSLVGFDTSALPDDAVVVQVRLQTTWDLWMYPSNLGALLLGWHTEDSAPDTWDADAAGLGQVALSEHDIVTGAVDVVLDWAASAVTAPGFGGLTVGPGVNESGLYAGSTSVDPDQWVLEIHYAS